MRVTNFVINFFLQDRKKFQAERKIYLGKGKARRAFIKRPIIAAQAINKPYLLAIS